MNKGRRNYRAGTGNQLALCQGMALLMYVGCPCVCGQNSLSMKNNEITASTFTGFGRQFWGGGGGLVVLSVWAILLLRVIIYNAVGMCTFYILEHVRVLPLLSTCLLRARFTDQILLHVTLRFP